MPPEFQPFEPLPPEPDPPGALLPEFQSFEPLLPEPHPGEPQPVELGVVVVVAGVVVVVVLGCVLEVPWFAVLGVVAVGRQLPPWCEPGWPPPPLRPRPQP